MPPFAELREKGDANDDDCSGVIASAGNGGDVDGEKPVGEKDVGGDGEKAGAKVGDCEKGDEKVGDGEKVGAKVDGDCEYTGANVWGCEKAGAKVGFVGKVAKVGEGDGEKTGAMVGDGDDKLSEAMSFPSGSG